eukprot:augustus_masked-scaffold_1-processed-gene-4.0-mRNA-1 protein AED:0.03 eAED:0.03 QI:0/0/0/1/1/1/2/0/700
MTRLNRVTPSGNSDAVFGKNTICREYADGGTGDFRVPSIRARSHRDGSAITSLKYVSHQIIQGKYDHNLPESMPKIRSHRNRTSGEASLVLKLKDRHTKLEVILVYVVLEELDVLIRRTMFRNTSKHANFFLEKVMSSTVDFEAVEKPYYMTHLSGKYLFTFYSLGSWARERHPTERKLSHGITAIKSTRGTSSHQHNPFVIISAGPPCECNVTQDHFAFGLVYSGNFLCEAEISDVGTLRMNVGLEEDTFRWLLEPGESFSSPECVLAYSNRGMEGISHTMHDLVRTRLLPQTMLTRQPCPILVNSWEAEYFNVSHDSIVAIARCAKQVGIELMVLDDGWFGERNGTTTSLGDWFPNREKFPFGLKGLANAVNGEGCKFGLWIEPEMISKDSKLYKDHPDWALHVPGRSQSEGRHQLVLDFSRDEVVDYIFNTLAAMFRKANIEYVKWDMNRHLTEVYSIKQPVLRQGEVSFRFMLGVYRLHKLLSEKFPNIRFEGCSGGGGRFDLGMLYYVHQIWASDNTDAHARMKIQTGTSWAYPAQVVGSHFSVLTVHFSDEDYEVHANNVRVFKQIRHVVRDGDLYRLWSPFKTNFCAWSYVTKDKIEAVVCVFNHSSEFWSEVVPRLKLRGLDPDASYCVTEPIPNNRTKLKENLQVVKTEVPVYQFGSRNVILKGRTLQNGGIPLKFFATDDAFLFYLFKVK